MKEYDNQVNDDHIDLKAIIAKPVTESSQQVENEKTKLQDLANATVDYKVENQDYNLPAKQMILPLVFFFLGCCKLLLLF